MEIAQNAEIAQDHVPELFDGNRVMNQDENAQQ